MAEALKLQYNEAFFARLMADIQATYPAFDSQQFQELLYAGDWEELELKARMRRITHALYQSLALPYREALEVLKPVAAKQPNSFHHMFFPEIVECYGLEDWEASLPALEHFTQFSSSEFSVRPFILQDPERMMSQMLTWTQHPNEHVRRLASEGCRPRLPWAMALPDFQRDPSPILPILTALKQDSSLYVRRSVANNLNDIAKDQAELVLTLSQQWFGQHPDTDWLIKHACRTLLKQGRPAALRLFGFEDAAKVQVSSFAASSEVIPWEGSCQFEAHILLPQDAEKIKLRIEYRVGFVRAKGKVNQKVFQISEAWQSTDQPLHISKTHSFRELSTRRHYPGKHQISLLINGEEKAHLWLELEKKQEN